MMEVLNKSLLVRYLLIFGLVLGFMSNWNGGFGVYAEETCDWKPDGSKVCSDEGNDAHNVWTEPLEEEVNSEDVSLNEIEMDLFIRFASQLKDWDPQDGFSKFNPEVIVLAILNAFNSVDANNDGQLDFEEIEHAFLEKQGAEEALSKVPEILGSYPDEMISIFECLNMFHKKGVKEMGPLLAPFERLKDLPVAGAKKLILGSVQMFVDSDKNFDGKLDRNEFSVGMEQAQEKRIEMGGQKVDVSEEQQDALFSIIDKDADDHLTYIEFQGTIPERQKTFGDSMDEVFATADKNSDGAISDVEFMAHMKKRSQEIKAKVNPTDKEILDAFDQLDVNEDRSLSKDEMMAMMNQVKRSQEQQILEAFNSFDKDGNGSLSLDELTEIVKGVEENSGQKLDAKTFMAMLDQNMDGMVSLEEMTTILTKLIK